MKHKTNIEIAKRDAILLAVDILVEHELGDDWTPEAHSARKRELLNIIDGGIK